MKEYTGQIKEEYLFHPTVKHQKLPLVGELDLISHQKIVDIKMTKQCSNKHIMQLIFVLPFM